ncbi:MAG: hypothetical protein ACLFWH_15140 [Actinomycetota bacterium]
MGQNPTPKNPTLQNPADRRVRQHLASINSQNGDASKVTLEDIDAKLDDITGRLNQMAGQLDRLSDRLGFLTAKGLRRR